MTPQPSLGAHLRAWLGAWPPPDGSVAVVGCEARRRAAWDGRVHDVVGVLTPDGGVLSVEPSRVDAVRRVVDPAGPWPDLAGLPGAVGRPQGRLIEGVFRYAERPVSLPDAGVWRPAGDPAVPPWLRPFGGEVLVALDDGGAYLAGVGLKRHHPTGWEIAVGTEPAARGQGLARRLVAQAARSVLATGAVVTYLHAFDNVASGRVADAAGFPDRGWRCVAVA